MTIENMHINFRGYAQKMGMQNIRAILDEDIDRCLNTAIINTVRDLLFSNVGPTNYPDKVIRQNTNIAPLNALRTLYSKCRVSEDGISISENVEEASEANPFKIIINNSVGSCILTNVMYYTGFEVSYTGKDLHDCRIIEHEDLGNVYKDYCNRPSFDAPIVTVYSDNDSLVLDLYTGSSYYIINNKSEFRKPKFLQITYIKYPNEVKYNKQDATKNVDCDLPAYLHDELVMNAANIYLASIGIGQSRNSNNKQTQ